MKILHTLVSIAAIAAMTFSAVASATVIKDDSSGILTPEHRIDFSGLTTGTEIGSLYAAKGITFTGLNATSEYSNVFPPTTAPAAINFYSTTNPTFNFNFATAVTDLSFYLVTNGYGTTITSYLKGVQVESFKVMVYNGPNSFQGFRNTMVDSVTLTVSDDYLALIDNVAFNTVETNDVPEPTSIALLGLGLAGIVLRRRKA